MDYKDVRDKFIELSGHGELLTTTGEDNGADFFLNAGQKYLDRFFGFSTGKTIARYPVIVTAGTYIAKTVGLRAIKEVWIANADGRSQLVPSTLSQLKTEYSEEFSSVTQGTPYYYAPAIFRPAPDSLNSVTGMYGVDDLLLYNATDPAQHFNYHGIVIMPPPGGTYTVEIVGLFYSPALSATLSGGVWTQTKSYWTEVHPDVLVEAALVKIEGLYRNTEGIKAFKEMLVSDVSGIDFDIIEEELTGSLQIGG